MTNPLRFISLFAGIGGFDLALERTGMVCVGQVEKDRHCQGILAHHFPNVKRMGDIRNVGYEDFEGCDVLVGGSPCQDVSVAGRRKGLAGERSGLWFEFHRLIREIRPKYVIFENVPGLLSSRQGRDFAVILGGFTGWIPDVPDAGWKSGGVIRGYRGYYHAAWRVLDAQYFGVPQRRRRVFIVASLGDGSCAEILFESESRTWNPQTRRKARQGAAGNAQKSAFSDSGPGYWREGFGTLRAEGENRPSRPSNVIVNNSSANNRDDERELAATVVSRQHKGGFTDPVNDNIIVVGTLAASGAGSSRPAGQANEADMLIVEGMDVRNLDSSGDVSPTLKGVASGTNQVPSVAFGLSTYETPKFAKELTPTLTVPSSTGGGQPMAVAFTQNQREEVRSLGDRVGALAADAGAHQQNYIAQSGVRRLTPVECERLQGFPDGWTEGQSDSMRYRQLGNAVAVPVVEWIGRRMVEVHSKDNP